MYQPKIGGVIHVSLQRNRENKTGLRNAILKLNQDFRAEFCEKRFFSNWWSHIFATKQQTDKIKIVLETLSFVVFSNFITF
jgi:hypothetical protein